jgi:hypothetical protein
MAVVLSFRGEVRRYGIWREASASHYMVREFLSPVDFTKRDRPGASEIPVLKVNRMMAFATGSYDYRFFTGLFFHRETGELVKGVGNCQNGCGSVSHSYLALDRVLRSDSYWEEEGTQILKLEPGVPLRFAEELPYLARMRADGDVLLAGEPLASCRSMLHPENASAETAHLLGTEDACEECADPSGTTTSGPASPRTLLKQELRIAHRGSETQLLTTSGEIAARFTYDRSGFLVGWEIPGHERFRRVSVFRGPYWQRTAPADRSILLGTR